MSKNSRRLWEIDMADFEEIKSLIDKIDFKAYEDFKCLIVEFIYSHDDYFGIDDRSDIDYIEFKGTSDGGKFVHFNVIHKQFVEYCSYPIEIFINPEKFQNAYQKLKNLRRTKELMDREKWKEKKAKIKRRMGGKEIK